MKETRIIGLLINDRVKESGLVQEILSKYASIIKSRLGFHEVSEDVCSRSGVIILQLTGDVWQWEVFENELSSIAGIEIQKMSFIL